VWLTVAPTVAGPEATVSLGLAAGAVAGVVIGLAVDASSGAAAAPSQINGQVRGRLGRLGRQLGTGFGKGAVAGVVVGVVAEFSYTVTFDFSDPARLGLLLGLVFGIVTGLAFGFANWLEMPADVVRAQDPASTLRADRVAKAVLLLVFGVAFGFTIGLATGLVAGPWIGLLDGVGVGLVGVAVGLARGPHVWSRYVFTRSFLTLQGKLPWRLSTFLDDAHRRGVLRENGGVHQFRHALLQDCLAGAAVLPPVEASPVPTTRSRARGSRVQQNAMLGVIALVAGVSLGVGLPIAGGLQTRCGVSPFDTDVRYLLAGLDSECVGVTDSSYVFSTDLQDSQTRIREENEKVRAGGAPYVRVALLVPLNAARRGVWNSKEIRHAVEGAYVAQVRANRASDGPKIELLLANEGSRQQFWQPVVDQLVATRTAVHPLVSVVGLGVSTGETQAATRTLSAHGIPMVAAMLNGAGLDGAIPGLFRMSPNNSEYVEALWRFLPTGAALMVTDGDLDPYTESLSRNLMNRFRLTDHVQYLSSVTGLDEQFANVANSVCTKQVRTVLFGGRPRDLSSLLSALAKRPCQLSVTVATEAIDPVPLKSQLHDAHTRVVYASPVDAAGWTKNVPGTPESFAPFLAEYRKYFSDPLDDGFAVLHHDAATVAFKGIRRAAPLGYVPAPAEVTDALRGTLGFITASGTITFAPDGSPLGKPIPVIELPSGSSLTPVYRTGE
jgi:ABC-type branched-subunit amino acid transport system substrate-binding protein